MNWLQRLPGSRKDIPGFEWRLLRKLPLITLVGTLLPALYALRRWSASATGRSRSSPMAGSNCLPQ